MTKTTPGDERRSSRSPALLTTRSEGCDVTPRSASGGRCHVTLPAETLWAHGPRQREHGATRLVAACRASRRRLGRPRVDETLKLSTCSEKKRKRKRRKEATTATGSFPTRVTLLPPLICSCVRPADATCPMLDDQ
ncbi:hypothetical protein EYF80_019528 [Liparis tanakae]|uniref:Uncharacterized protein n=1 Tax=Liparis tanakae TaxID=230148 RepID=A0A4Z2HZ90_9TELE|nr:hypothetical protein EYF80_019528 [Liparis tanakae]